MIVVDASAVIEVLIGRPPPTLAPRLAAETTLHAPHLLDTEVLHVLRRLVASARLSEAQADEARDNYDTLTIDRYPHAPLSDRVWELRGNLSAYDATYVALAEALDATMVTTDTRLAAAPRIPAVVELHA